MPNWCDNFLIIEGEETQIRQLLSTTSSEETEFDFNKVAQEPEEFEEGENWYTWREKHWGTKWNSNADTIVRIDYEQGKMAKVHFSTAWSPPEPIIKKLSELFPDLKFTLWFEEMNMDFSGYIVYEQGAEKDSAEGDYNKYWNYFDENDEWIQKDVT